MMQHNRREFLALAAACATGLHRARAAAAAQSAAPRMLFDGKTLAGWRPIPRLMVPNDLIDSVPSASLREAVVARFTRQAPERFKNSGRWSVEDGAIVGGQMGDTGLGAYLLSEEKFGDFELTFEARPDFPIDTGVMVRAHELGCVGFQVLIDHRQNGCIGGIYGNNVGAFRAYPFVVDGDEQEGFRVSNLREGTADGAHFKPDKAATLQDFLKAWRPNEWNQFRVRSVGRLPVIETWINGTPIATLDTAKLADRVPGYDPEKIFQRIGPKGHIALEVHDNGRMGRNRWAPGAVCRYRNIGITEL